MKKKIGFIKKIIIFRKRPSFFVFNKERKKEDNIKEKTITYGIDNAKEPSKEISKKEIKLEINSNPNIENKKILEDKKKIIENKKEIEAKKTVEDKKVLEDKKIDNIDPIEKEPIKPIPTPTKPITKVISKSKDKEKVIKIKKDKKENITNINKNDTNSLNITLSILNEIDIRLKKNYYEIQELSYNIDYLDKENKDNKTSQELEILIDKLQKLIQEFEKIKKKFYKENKELLASYCYNDDISALLDEYISLAKTGKAYNAVILQFKQIENYLNILNKIATIETKSDKLKNNLDEKLTIVNQKEKDSDNFYGNILEIEKMNDYITSYTATQSELLNKIKNKLLESEEVTKTVKYKSEIILNYSNLFTSTLLMATTAIIPPTKSGNFLKSCFMVATIVNALNLFKVRAKEKETITKVKFIDYEKDIKNNINNVYDINLMINKGINDISYLKKEFEHEFASYADSIPNYYEMLKKLDLIEKDLLAKSKIIKGYSEELNQALTTNNIKVKKLEEEYH